MEHCDTPLNEMTTAAAARAIADGTITSEHLVQACLERIEAREGEVGAWSHLDPDKAIAQARARDGEPSRGLLHGVPIGVKDLIDTTDMPTTYGSPLYQGNRPAWDASCVALAREAGAVILGKTVSSVFATYDPGKTANPHNTGHTPGGSSSGSAAAVGANMVPVAFGTQTAASVIRPASYCGVVGYASTSGSLNLAGIKILAPSMDSLGVMVRSVADAQLMRAVLIGSSPAPEARSAPPRIGLCRTPYWAEAGADMRSALDSAVQHLAAAGVEVREVELAAPFAALNDAQNVVMTYELARSFAYEYLVWADKLTPKFKQLVETGRAHSYADYVEAQAAAQHCGGLLDEVFADHDVLLAPSAPGEAEAGLGYTGAPTFSRMWALLRLPAVNLPGHSGAAGLPVGVQVLGRYGGDDGLLAAAAWMETRVA